MARTQEVVASFSPTNVTVTTTSETAAITSDPVKATRRHMRVAVVGLVEITLGTGATALSIRVRRGSGTSGTSVLQIIPDDAAAGDRIVVPILTADTVEDVESVVYTITVAVTGATADSTIENASIFAVSM